ncbi:MAG: type I restriction enzyme HsdR N-terminal domain-containing protein [Chitinophagales bacterium]|nr:type I restriction enzyme HsdR N-terminal domain-containing protein [Bacteroidota bacterium]MBP7399791.1 type I restriction enzyme HsdR N-terminal domain-containing protein [Chitinophagales bacterium]MBK8487168.1 type I restriction enzyme HsdR N-terminal domain-containing protein [Bacteroidota bacterium]MBK8680554.1 type I restriction enzyme HsdR N-terminal domain-containing protein [Bacteroidota bacterium]MBP8752681.1 type I restriction enzyme HsdR N-terminal domain-containing protein [Chit
MQLLFSEYQFNIKRSGDKELIFDRIRKKFVVLTPEEWVRQHLVWYFIETHGFPAALISIEKKITLNGLTKRTDIVLFNKHATPVMLVECKAPAIKLSQNVLDQAGRYNLVLKVPYLVISNGNDTICTEIIHSSNTFKMLDTLPDTKKLLL